MKEINISDRLEFLATSFDVFEFEPQKQIEYAIKIKELKKLGWDSKLITSTNTGNVLAIISEKLKVTVSKIDGDNPLKKDVEYYIKKLSISSDVFASMVEADPTENKMYLQWMLNLFARLIKDNNVDSNKQSLAAALRFVDEDLPQANKYLTLFESNKRKKLFKQLCKSSYTLKDIADPTDINQYKSLSQLFESVDPFIEKEPSAVENMLKRFVESGQAMIPVKDRKFTLYIPLTLEASVIFEKFASWCTAVSGNGMFRSYTENNKKPNGKNSNIYIIINNKFFTNESDEIYQVHFESGQIKDRKNGSNVSIFEQVINESEGLSKYFYDELMGMAKQNKKGIEENKYLDYLIQFGFAESLFEFMEIDTPSIKFMKREIPRLPDLTRFKNLDSLIITNAKLVELHPSIGHLNKLDMLVLTGNKIKSLPKEIGLLKNVTFINLVGNPIKHFPAEIANLDTSKGGHLFRIGVKKEEIGEENYRKLKELLPNTEM